MRYLVRDCALNKIELHLKERFRKKIKSNKSQIKRQKLIFLTKTIMNIYCNFFFKVIFLSSNFVT